MLYHIIVVYVIYYVSQLWNAMVYGNCATSWVIRDVMFQDVGFENNSLQPLTHISFR